MTSPADFRRGGHFLIASTPGSLYVQVVGLATLNNSTSLVDALGGVEEQGVRQFVFDLGPCSGFDSTFMGILVGLTRGGGGRSVVLVNSNGEHRRLLGEVGVDRVVRLHLEPVQFPPIELRRLGDAPAGPERRIRSIVSAHEHLVSLGGANIEKFGAVLEGLKRELGEDGPSQA